MRSTTFAPLQHRAFALILLGSLLSNFGNAIQSVGAAWHLTEIGEPADIVALVQTAVNLPIMILALPAGAWADLLDRRLIMLAAQSGMFVASLLLAILVWDGAGSPLAIISLTAILAAGVACFNPALAASLRSTVSRTELAAAVALSILAFNVARTLGPAIGGGIVAWGGASAAFVANGVSYLVVIFVLWRWQGEKGTVGRRTGKGLLATISEGLRIAWAVREIRTILIRAFTFTSAGAAAWALMPLVSSELLGEGSTTYGVLLGALGLGAVIGAASSTWFRNRFAGETVVRFSAITYGVSCIGVALQPNLVSILLLLVIAGAGWVQALSCFAVAGQLWAPAAAVGRVVAMVSSLTFGGIALGSWLWGHAAEYLGIAQALTISGLAMLLLPLVGIIYRMPELRPRQTVETGGT